MKKKELKQLANKIAKQERIIQDSNSTKEQKKRAESEILTLSSHVETLEDITIIDELVQDILTENS